VVGEFAHEPSQPDNRRREVPQGVRPILPRPGKGLGGGLPVFTGLVQSLGEVAATERSPDGVVVRIRTGLAADLREGDSVAVNGICLTATEVAGAAFAAEVMNETLRRSSLQALEPGARVNLELPLRAGDRLGGHFVQGHVDGLGEVSELAPDGFARRVRIEAEPELLRYIVHKGSIAVDGISLTVAEIDSRSFTVSLIPETLERTTLGAAAPGSKVNLEVAGVATDVTTAAASPPHAAVQARLADVGKPGLVEKQQLLNVGSLEKPAKEYEELLLLLGREARPMLAERRAAHSVGVKKFREED